MKKLLSELKEGQKGKIDIIKSQNVMKTLASLGIIPGEEVSVFKKSFWGCPMYIYTNKCRVVLRKREADLIEINV